MNQIQTDKIRNIAFIAHGGAGKTSLAEAALFNAGAVNRLGKVEEGNTVMDFLPEEISRRANEPLRRRSGIEAGRADQVRHQVHR